jgi:hypothetical protein
MLFLLSLNLLLPIFIAVTFFSKKIMVLPWVIALNVITSILTIVFHLFFFLPIK